MVDLHTDVYSIRNLVSISESKEEAYRRFARLHGISIDKPTALKVFDNAIHQKFPKVIEKTLLEKVQAKYEVCGMKAEKPDPTLIKYINIHR